MKKTRSIIFILFTILISNCSPISTSTEFHAEEKTEEISTPTALETVEIADTQSISPLDRKYKPSPDNITLITIDGDKSDWAPYPAGISDPTGDSSGNVDVTFSYAFTNEEYLYLLFEVDGEIGSYVQVDIDINPHQDGRPPDFMIIARPNKDSLLSLNRILDGEFIQLGEMGVVSQKDAFELRFPLKAFDGPTPETVSLRVMDGICCDDEWLDVEGTAPFPILHTNELELLFTEMADLTSKDSAFCGDTSLNSPDFFKPAENIQVPVGFKASIFVPPSGLNVPSDVIVTSKGDILIASSRLGEIHKVNEDGSVSLFSKASTYALDQDDSGNIYGYMFPDGEIFRLNEEGEYFSITRIQDTACESTLAAAPNGTLFIGFNFCTGDVSGQTTIYMIPPGGNSLKEVVGEIGQGVQSLDINSDGVLYAVLGNSLEIIDVATGTRNPVALLPDLGSAHGLVVDDTGTAYVSTGDMEPSGDLYRVDKNGDVALIASFNDNGLEGLALTPDGEIIGTQRSIGGVKIINKDGLVQDLVKPNGLVSPHTIVISPCGELIAVNDEAGGLTIAAPSGENSHLIKLNSFQPPQTFLAFSPDGWYVTGESAPGFPSFLKRYLPSGLSEILADDISEVSGVAVGQDGSIYASATGSGEIIKILPDGSRTIIADGLSYPQALAITEDEKLLVVTGGMSSGDVFSMPQFGDTVVLISPDGSKETLAKINAAADIAVANDDSIYIPAENAVYRVSMEGNTEVFAEGFNWVRGAAFDISGNLLVADDSRNAIYQISGFPQGSLRCSVVNLEDGLGIADATIRITQSIPPYAGRIISSDSNGEFSFPVAPDTYSLTIWKEGYQQTLLEEIEIVENEETSQIINLTK